MAGAVQLATAAMGLVATAIAAAQCGLAKRKGENDGG
jgi:hypothetical protein